MRKILVGFERSCFWKDPIGNQQCEYAKQNYGIIEDHRARDTAPSCCDLFSQKRESPCAHQIAVQQTLQIRCHSQAGCGRAGCGTVDLTATAQCTRDVRAWRVLYRQLDRDGAARLERPAARGATRAEDVGATHALG
eukprot:3856848-Pleurochrysis_carterae.AAC.1